MQASGHQRFAHTATSRPKQTRDDDRRPVPTATAKPSPNGHAHVGPHTVAHESTAQQAR